MDASRSSGTSRPTVEVVTLSRHELAALVAEATEAGAHAAAERYEQTLRQLTERLEAAATRAGLKEWITTDEAAAYAGLTGRRRAETVLAWIKAGLSDRGPLSATRTSRGWRVKRTDLEAWLATESAPEQISGRNKGA
ncbi:MAG: helix-turn-helix domain-containing protein [Bacteroidota bacterium]